MTSSAHAYVRGSTHRFYEWLLSSRAESLPKPPDIWIGGDCHIGNIGALAHADGSVELELRDLDQTVIGSPAHDVVRLALSMVMSVRASGLRGSLALRGVEAIAHGYARALTARACDRDASPGVAPPQVKKLLRQANARSRKDLLIERIGVEERMPMGKRFWPLMADERAAVEKLASSRKFKRLVTQITGRQGQRRRHPRGRGLLGEGLQLARPVARRRLGPRRRPAPRNACPGGHQGGEEGACSSCTWPAASAERWRARGDGRAQALSASGHANDGCQRPWCAGLHPRAAAARSGAGARYPVRARRGARLAYLGAVVGIAHARQLSPPECADRLAKFRKDPAPRSTLRRGCGPPSSISWRFTRAPTWSTAVSTSKRQPRAGRNPPKGGAAPERNFATNPGHLSANAPRVE